MPSLDYALKWAAPQAEQQTQAKEPEKSKWSLDSLKRVLDSQGQMQIDLAKEQRRMAPKHLRNIATAPAVALELPLLAYNIPAWIYGNDGYSPSGRSARAIDKFAEEKLGLDTRPRQDSDKIFETITQQVASMPFGGPLGKGIGAAGRGLGSLAAKTLPKGAMAAAAIPKAAGAATAIPKVPLTVRNVIPRSVERTGKITEIANELSPRNIMGTTLASGASQHMLNEDPDNFLGALGAGLAASAVNQTGFNAMGRVMAKDPYKLIDILSSHIKYNPKKHSRLIKAGIDPTMADVVDRPSIKTVQKWLENDWAGGPMISEARNNQSRQVLENLGAYKSDLTPSSSGELIYRGAVNRKQRMSKVSSDMFNALNRKINNFIIENPNERFVKIDKPIQSLSKEFIKLETPQMKSDFLKSDQGKLLTKMIDMTPNRVFDANGKIDIVKSLKGSPDNMKVPFEDAMSLRRNLDDRLSEKFGIIGDRTQGDLKHIRGMLKEGQSDFIKKIGPSAEKSWNRANRFYSNYAEKEVPIINKISKTHKISEVDNFNNIIKDFRKGEISSSLAMKGLKQKDRSLLTNSIISDLGKDNFGDFDYHRFYKNYNSLPEVQKSYLTSNLTKESLSKLNSTLESINSIKESSSRNAPSGSSMVRGGMNLTRMGIGALLGATTGEITAPAAFGIASLAVPSALANLFTNKNLLDRMHKSIASKTSAQLKAYNRRRNKEWGGWKALGLAKARTVSTKAATSFGSKTRKNQPLEQENQENNEQEANPGLARALRWEAKQERKNNPQTSESDGGHVNEYDDDDDDYDY